MNYLSLVRIALRALNQNKSRGILTMLGIIIGVGSVITMLAVGQGAKRWIQDEISSMGTNMMVIFPSHEQVGGVRQSAAAMQSLKLEDYEAIVHNTDFLAYCTPLVTVGGQAIYGANNTPTTIYGAYPEYLNIRKIELASGELFTRADVRTFAKVCVVGKTVVDNLFPNGEDPLGKVIRFNKIPIRIIGVLASKGYNMMSSDSDDLILAPFTTVQKRLLAISHIHSIYASVVAEEQTDQAIAQITEQIRHNHKLTDGVEDDFEIHSQEELSSIFGSVTDAMTILLACIAGISLLVGGIGIMNIMYVSVTERTREIGLRMSIGAKGRHILVQFLIEALVISVTGGVIGVGIGFGVAGVINLFGFPATVQWYAVVMAFAVCTLTGIFFGWYPAKKAASLDPIDAIRYE